MSVMCRAFETLGGMFKSFLFLILFRGLFGGPRGLSSGVSGEECGSVFTARQGVISSPNFPDPFQTPIHCRWVVDASGWSDHSSITVYLTQLFLRSGLKFTGYNSKDEYERMALDSCSTREVTMYDILHTTNYSSPTKYLEIELKLDRLEGNHLRVEDSLLDVFGFNLTYEVGSIPKTTCNVVSCSFLGHCYASSDFRNYECSCFDEYYGDDCSSGPSCNSTENPCKNGASCWLVGASTVFCNCSDSFSGQRCENLTSSEILVDYADFGEDSSFETVGENQQQPSVCEYCEGNPNCLMQCNYGHRESVCDYPSHYVIDLEVDQKDYSEKLPARSSSLSNFSSESFKTLLLSSLSTLSVLAEPIEIEFFNAAKIHIMAPREDGEVIKKPEKLFNAMGLSYINATVSEEPLLTLQNMSISFGQQIWDLGDDFNITCLAQGSKSLIFQWFKDNNPIKEDYNRQISERILVADKNYASILFIHDTTINIQGQYTCQVSDFNSFLKQHKSLEVFVMSESKGQRELKKELIEKNGNITLPCSTDYCTCYFWKKNNAVFNMSHNEFWEDIFPTGSVLKSFQIQESVNYTCQMAGPTGMHAIEYQITVDSTRCADDSCEKICYRDKLLSCGSYGNCALLKDCDEASKDQLECKIEDTIRKVRFDAMVNMTNLRVARDHDTLVARFLTGFNSSIFSHFNEENVSIKNLDTTLFNNTHFKVEFIVNEQDMNFSRLAVQDLVRERKISREPGARITFSKTDELFLEDLRSDGHKVFENDELSLSCTARGGKDSVSFEWYKDGLRIDKFSSRQMWSDVNVHNNRRMWSTISCLDTEYTAILGIFKASKLNQGWYTCRVFDGKTQFCKSVKVTVISAPQITIEPLSQTIRREENVSIRCRHKSTCPDKRSQHYEWMKNGKSLNSGDDHNRERYNIRTMIDGGSHLELFHMQESAEYSCQLVCNQLKSLVKTSYVCVSKEDSLICRDDGWPDTVQGCSVYERCPAGYMGDYVSRVCSFPSFSLPNGSLCIKSQIADFNYTLNQLSRGYQNGSVELLLISFHNLVRENSTYLHGEAQSLLSFVDDFWIYFKFSAHGVNLTAAMEVSCHIMSLLLQHLDSTVSPQNFLSLSNMMHSWMFLSMRQSFHGSPYHKISSSNIYAASQAIHNFEICSSSVPVETSNGTWVTPLIDVHFQSFPCDESKLEQTNISMIVFKNSVMFFPANISQSFDDGREFLHRAESVIVSVAMDNKIKILPDKINLTLTWKITLADEWNVSCSLIQHSIHPLNTSVCKTFIAGRNLITCSCFELGAFTLIHSKYVYSKADHSNLILSAAKWCAILATSVALIRVAVRWVMKNTMLFFLKIIICAMILWYLIQVFSNSDPSMDGGSQTMTNVLGLSSLQILIVSLLTSQLLVIYFKTCELLSMHKILILLAVNGIPVFIMFVVDYVLKLGADVSSSSPKIVLLCLLFFFNCSHLFSFLCLRHKMKSQCSGNSLMREEINSGAVLLILIAAVESLQILSSLNSYLVLLNHLFCFLLSSALMAFYCSIISADRFLGCFGSLCLVLPDICFQCESVCPESSSKTQASNLNSIDDCSQLSEQTRQRLIRTGLRMSQERGRYFDK